MIFLFLRALLRKVKVIQPRISSLNSLSKNKVSPLGLELPFKVFVLVGRIVAKFLNSRCSNAWELCWSALRVPPEKKEWWGKRKKQLWEMLLNLPFKHLRCDPKAPLTLRAHPIFGSWRLTFLKIKKVFWQVSLDLSWDSSVLVDFCAAQNNVLWILHFSAKKMSTAKLDQTALQFFSADSF